MNCVKIGLGLLLFLGFAFVADLPTRTLFTIGGLLILFGLTELDTGRLVEDVIDFGEFCFVVVLVLVSPATLAVSSLKLC